MAGHLKAKIKYSDKYYDDKFEYRHVTLPKELLRFFPRDRLLTEDECRKIGIEQSRGWVHYATHG